MHKNNKFTQDIIAGLGGAKKYINSKYLYDNYGSQIFNKITTHEDYYLTNCEIEILTNNKQDISQLLENQSFNLIELGPGEGIKSALLIEQFLKDARDFSYIAVDISQTYLEKIRDKLKANFSALNLAIINQDYYEELKLEKNSHKKNLLLFLGSSIGNFHEEETKIFLKKIWHALNNHDYFLVGFDLDKQIDLLMRAYSDKDGLTRDFNLNLLTRMNRELETNFNINNFAHVASFNKQEGAMQSHLHCLKQHEVYSPKLERKFYFEKSELIHVEFSYKYKLEQIKQFAACAGFEIVKNFYDTKNYFLNSLWRVIKSPK